MSCRKNRTDLNIVVSENNRAFRLKNPNRREIVEIKVDGCLINDERKRCDYLFEIPIPENRACFVELKGKHVEEAAEQIFQTMNHTKHQYAQYKKEAYIIASRVPQASPSIQQKQHQLKKIHNAILKIKSNEFQLDIP